MSGLIIGVLDIVITKALSVVKPILVGIGEISVLKNIGKAIIRFAQALGLFKLEQTTEELGDKALQAEETGIKPERFEHYDDYVETVEKYKLDPEKSQLSTEREKIEKGIELIVALTAVRYKELPMGDFFAVAAQKPEYFKPERMERMAELVLNDHPNMLEGVTDYIKRTGTNDEVLDTVEKFLIDLERSLDNKLTPDEALDIISQI